mmetsp:Transcript_25333/g.45684  ORF Transcript_25333/g.45684 Transcript_25333/m.45684 type:complete len:372 (-) Transcript_25333:261-1376(-)|eukprot:CAMPEP_0201886024 /NCGR_PEP_ID=MMETSP0902-20130614/21002_1 /ASSEMBLY_ACC=CAM_ASM_000551 /TAXON_ID=420261 /ORGANISM="Thalassiosira antarctica, Strain CCMP982" /LENGTH=371 /DNA_ID=CAMNT_0048415485 /DNA_START=37 /DNA_END=1152 /DNA_ORIENTATION=+
MASKAWYRPSALPQLIAKFDPPQSATQHARKKCIEVWTTTCIVTNFGMRRGGDNTNGTDSSSQQQHPQCSTLLNPANPYLTGPNTFPYFPRGGPQPLVQPQRPAHHIMGYVSQWGGMDVGSGMLFSAEAIDGLVHQQGGLRLRAECSLVPTHDYAHAYVNQQATEAEVKNNDTISDSLHTNDMKAKCPVGTAVMTSPGGDELRQHYDCILHTTPPFYNHPPQMTKELKQTLRIEEEVSDLHSWSRELLRSCYRQSFHLAFENNTQMEEKSSFFRNPLGLFGFGKPPTSTHPMRQRVAVPLMGAGCRAFPKDLALEIAALESASWLSTFDLEHTKEAEKRNDADESDMAVVFGLLEREDAEALSEQLETLLR